MGRNPLATLTARHGTVTTVGSVDLDAVTGRRVGGAGGMLAALEAVLDSFDAPDLPELPPLHAGLVGYLGYDVVREVEHLPAPPADDLGHPDAVLAVIGQLAAFDHWRQRVVLVDNVIVDPDWDDEQLERAHAEASSRLDGLAADCFRPLEHRAQRLPGDAGAPAGVRRTMSDGLYEDAVRAAKEHIVAGDVFQVVLSQRYDLGELGADPFDVYRVLRLVNPSPYLYFLRFPEVTVVGASPEPMVRLREGTVVSRPIAGSRRRGATAEEDGRLEGELVEDPKELAEHVMLVDLARNDVGRVVSFGTERVDELMVVERYSHIMHLTSQVSGRLAPGKGPVDVLRATLPAGTLSGAPKVRAMEIIDDLEPTKRGVYGGVVGYLDFSGNLDTAIAIRTMTVSPDGRASVQAGAGIVADSDPSAENAECADKAAALLAARGHGPSGGGRVRVPEHDRSVSGQYAALRRGAAVRLLPRDVVSVEGDDAEPYLQGQCSQELTGLGSGRATDALLLSPQGRIDAVVRVSRLPDGGFLVDTDAGFGPVVVARLERFRLRMRVQIAAVPGWWCVAVRGPDAAGAVTGSPALVLPVEWPGLAGVDLLGRAPPDLSAWVDGRAVPCGEEAWEAARIEAGCPLPGRDPVEGSIAAETGLVARTVSFTKGCYTGQELVARLDARGSNVARRLCGVVAGAAGPDEDLPPVGAAVLSADGEHEVGRLSSVAWSPGLDRAVALAMVHRRVAPPEEVRLRWDTRAGPAERPAEARPLPLTGDPAGTGEGPPP